MVIRVKRGSRSTYEDSIPSSLIGVDSFEILNPSEDKWELKQIKVCGSITTMLWKHAEYPGLIKETEGDTIRYSGVVPPVTNN